MKIGGEKSMMYHTKEVVIVARTERQREGLIRALSYVFFKLIVSIARFFGLSKAETKKLLRNDYVQDSVEKSIIDVHSSVV